METGYLLAFTTGLIGGFGHCIGMCGPIAGSLALSGAGASRSAANVVVPHLLYNSGRIATYAAVGAMMGLSGSFLNAAGRIADVQNAVAVLAGIVMVLMGLSIAGTGSAPRWLERRNAGVLRAAGRITSSSSALRFLPLGLVLGLLPCGLSYTVFVASAGSGGIVPGMLTALLFGLGTLPALLAFGAAVSSIGPAVRGRFSRVGGLLVVLMGIYYLYRGIRLYAVV